MDKTTLYNEIINQISPPAIPDHEFSAVEFEIIPDNGEILTQKLQAAIDYISQKGGGKLILPSGTYLTGALQLRPKVELCLRDSDTCLKFIFRDLKTNYPLVLSHWEGSPCYNFSPLIYAYEAEDIAVTGQGILDGGADPDHWWNWHYQVENAWSEDKQDLQLRDRILLRSMNVKGVPVSERVFGDGHYLRPSFFQPYKCRRVLLKDVTFKNAPMWQSNPVMCEMVTIDHVTFDSHGPNNDGCDPESCTGVVIKNCLFNTGDDCISLKSGRDRDGQLAAMPCSHVLIEHNEFADGHGGIALGSEMSGGILYVLADHNRFSSPNLTYGLRLKTNAKRGGKVAHIMLANSTMEHVHGAAVHGTMLYEDGRNGNDLPEFQDIVIENLEATGGDYGIFLEAFPEVPIRGLKLKNICIQNVKQEMRSMNWQDAVIDNVIINGKSFPRPGYVRIQGIPARSADVTASAEYCGSGNTLHFLWLGTKDLDKWITIASGERITVPTTINWIKLRAMDPSGNCEESIPYKVLSETAVMGTLDFSIKRLITRGVEENLFYRYSVGMPLEGKSDIADIPITRLELSQMLQPLTDSTKYAGPFTDVSSRSAQLAVGNHFMCVQSGNLFNPNGLITRQEMATVAMQACRVNYRNASTTMPICADRAKVSNNFGTNVARALYFKFMCLDDKDQFRPLDHVTFKEAIKITERVMDFAGL
jgi:polygalacturonase